LSALRGKASAVSGRVSKVASGKLFVLIITNFVDMVGLLMIIPLMPFYAREMGGGALIVAVLMGAFTAAQLLSAPLWGRFSDRYGRRAALLLGIAAIAGVEGGVQIAEALPEQTLRRLFGALMLAVAGQIAVRAWRKQAYPS